MPENILKGIKVLWVEDDTFLGNIVSSKLTQAGAEYMQAVDGQAAFAYLEHTKPDAIVLDIMLPHQNGFEILEKLKNNQNTHDIPVIVLSNLAEKQDMDRCFQLGAHKFFVKALVTLDHIIDEIILIATKK